MIKYPEIQSKVQAEIHDKVGLSRPVTMEDKINLPFTEAVIHEILRYNFSNFSLCFPHLPTFHRFSFSFSLFFG